MRRLKAIYLIPVFLVLEIGAVCAVYFWLIVPQMDNVKKAEASWKEDREKLRAVEPKYRGHLQAQQDNARALLDNYYRFAAIQRQMPNIKNEQAVYGANESTKQAGLVEWYRIMGTGQLANELRRWARRFGVSGVPDFVFSGTLGYEDTLPSVKLVEVPFESEQQFVARGFPALLAKIQRTTGYGYYPLIIGLPNDTATITVNRKDPRHRPNKPLLTMPYSCKAYFMTRGWDPNESIQADVPAAMGLLENPPAYQPPLTKFDKPCPNVLWVFPAKDTSPQ